MPFPRVKGHVYDDAHRVPFVVYWPGRLESTRRVPDLVTLTDLAPTGQARVDRQAWSVVSVGGVIPEGSAIRVAGITGVRLEVVLDQAPKDDVGVSQL